MERNDEEKTAVLARLLDQVERNSRILKNRAHKLAVLASSLRTDIAAINKLSSPTPPS